MQILGWDRRMKRIISYTIFIAILSACSGGTSRLGGSSKPDAAAPTLNPIGNRVVLAGNGINFTLSASDPNGSALTYSTVGSVGVGDPYNVDSGNNATFSSANGLFTWTPNITDIGIYTVQFIVTNAEGKSDSETITITVTSTSVIAGQSLFLNHCSSCHDVTDFSGVTVTETLISDAIAGNVGGMGSLSFLTTSQRQDIANYLESL